MPVNGETDEFGKEEAFLQPILHVREHIGRAEDMQRRAAGAQPERLDERGDLSVVVAVHVTDPENLGNIGLDLLLEEKAGGGGAAVEKEAAFLGLEENAGMFAASAGVAVRGAEEDGAHKFDDARFLASGNGKASEISFLWLF